GARPRETHVARRSHASDAGDAHRSPQPYARAWPQTPTATPTRRKLPAICARVPAATRPGPRRVVDPPGARPDALRPDAIADRPGLPAASCDGRDRPCHPAR